MTTRSSHDLEISRDGVTRAFEILPGLTSWIFLLSPILLSFVQPVWVAYIIIAYYLLWLTKAFGLSTRLLRGYRRLHLTAKINWSHKLQDLNNVAAAHKFANKQLKKRISPNRRAELRLYRKHLRG